MKRFFLPVFGFAVFVFLFLIGTAPYAFSAAETFQIDPQHSYVLWHVTHFNFSTQVGKWYVSGTLMLDKDNPQNSKVHVSIPVAKVVTGIPELDQHLQKKVFFDVQQFPIATFVSDTVQVTSKNTAKIYGILTVRGIAKSIIIDAKLNRVGISPITEKMTAGFSGITKVKRSDFGINTALPGLGDEVQLDIEVEASPPGPPKGTVPTNGNAPPTK